MREKQAMKTDAPPVFGIFNPTTVGQIPFEVERRIERARLELEAELKEDRKKSLSKLKEKLVLGAELHLQNIREDIVRRSQLLAENPQIFNRTKYYIEKEARKLFGLKSEASSTHDMFAQYDAGEETLSDEKKTEIKDMILIFLQKYKEDLDKIVATDLEEERKYRLDEAEREALRVAEHWENLISEDADALNETCLQDAKLKQHLHGVDTFEGTINYCSSASDRQERSLHSGYTPSTFDISALSGRSDNSLFKSRLFTPESFFDKAMK